MIFLLLMIFLFLSHLLYITLPLHYDPLHYDLLPAPAGARARARPPAPFVHAVTARPAPAPRRPTPLRWMRRGQACVYVISATTLPTTELLSFLLLTLRHAPRTWVRVPVEMHVIHISSIILYMIYPCQNLLCSVILCKDNR